MAADECGRQLSLLRAGLSDPRSIRREGPGQSAAAVLVPIFVRDSALHVLYILRSNLVATHRGQVAFPGGRLDARDDSLAATALREADEEVAIDPASVELLGAFRTMLTSTSGMTVASFAGLIPAPTNLRANPYEVAEIFSVPMAVLRDPGYRGSHRWRRDGPPMDFPAIVYGGRPIWGLTYRITLELLEILG
ncbi:MAG: NUDIX hydrolase [Candidatus Binataceae bacterium]